jgi:hypothetical protein
MATKKLPKKTPAVVYLSRRASGDYQLTRGPGIAAVDENLDRLAEVRRRAAGENYEFEGTADYEIAACAEEAAWEEHDALYMTSFCPKMFHHATGIRLRKNTRDVAVTINFKLA